MIKHNELIIDGVGTSSFPFKVIVEDSPTIQVRQTKTLLTEHRGMSGAILQTNRHRPVIEKTYRLYLIHPTELGLNEFSAYLSKENFWLESEQVQLTRLWCYKVDDFTISKDSLGVYYVDVTFLCHPTRFFKKTDRQVLSSSGVIETQGSALAYPTITLTGQSLQETSFTVGKQVIRIERFTEPLVMVNHPGQPSFKTLSGKPVNWSGDFITLDASLSKIGVALGDGILKMTVDVVWGWI